MARRAPAVDRAIAVLNFLAAHPGERFTLSEIARPLDLNKATLHAILGGLAAAGYVLREPVSKAYSLGPALIALGTSALGSSPAVHYALPQMEAVGRELELDCVASAAIGDEIVVLARTGIPRPFGINIQPGHRLPLAPPLGTVFVAWSGADEIDRWLGKVGPSAADEDLERYRRAVKAVRARGYSVGLTHGRGRRLVEALGEAGGPALEEGVAELRDDEYALVELGRAPAYRLNHIGAPVFGPSGAVVLALFLIGFQDQMPAEHVPLYGTRLRGAASTVTKAIGGQEPE